MYRVLVTGAIHEKGIEQLEQEPDLEVDFRPDLPLPEVIQIIEPYHCIISRSETPVQKELIEKAVNLKVIARAAVGIGNIDVDYATEKGVLVINTPGKNTNSAAELTMGLLLDVMRKVTPAHQNMQRGGWDRHQFTGFELMGKTIGIIGLGNVGHRMAQFARGFDMNVVAYDPYITDEVFQRHRAQKMSLADLLTQSDIISLHTPKNKETIGMIGSKEIAKMKRGSIILNAARGEIVDEMALLDAIKSKHIAGAGIDTWSVEPLEENIFQDFPQVVMTPHIGASTVEAQIRIAESIAEQVPRALRGEIVDFPINMPQIQMLDDKQVSSYSVLAEKLGSFTAQYIDFNPTHLEIKYRGSLAKQDCSLLRLAFLKGFLKYSQDYVSYVNADQIAESVGLHVSGAEDPGFSDYESAIKFILMAQAEEFEIGGVVFSGIHPRITLINNFVFEIAPEGIVLVAKNKDYPGMIGVIGTILGEHRINIAQFELSRNVRGGEAMSLIRVDDDIPESVIEELKCHEGITQVKKIVI